MFQGIRQLFLTAKLFSFYFRFYFLNKGQYVQTMKRFHVQKNLKYPTRNFEMCVSE